MPHKPRLMECLPTKCRNRHRRCKLCRSPLSRHRLRRIKANTTHEIPQQERGESNLLVGIFLLAFFLLCVLQSSAYF